MKRDLLSKLGAYIDGSMSREEFSVWFYDFSRMAEKRFSGAVLEFVYEVERILAEASSGHWSERDLVNELKALVLEHPRSEVWSFTKGSPANVGLTGHPIKFGSRSA